MAGLISNSNEDYDCVDYWNKRYENEEEFEWCKDYEVLKPLLSQTINKNDSILILGCGNSRLGVHMYNDGYHSITNIDYSTTVISNMSKQYPHLQWKVMDMLNLEVEPSSYDIVIEKATLDVLFVKEKSPWHISNETETRLNKVLQGISQVLKPNGKFISITFAQPHFRRKYYEQYWYQCEQQTFGHGFHYYFYTMRNKK